MNALLFYVGTLVYLLWLPLAAFNIKTVSTSSEIVHKRLVWLRCSIEKNELGLLHRDVAIQTDNPAIQVGSWRVDKPSEQLASPVLSKIRNMYTNTFSIAVSLQSSLSDEALQQALAETRIYVKGLLLKNNHTHKKWYISPLLTAIAMIPAKVAMPISSNYNSLEAMSSTSVVTWKNVESVWLDWPWIDAFTHVWDVLKQIGSALNSLWILFGLCIFMVWCVVRKKRYLPAYTIALGLSILLVLLHAKSLIGLGGMYGTVALWLLLCAGYLLRPASPIILGPLHKELCTVLSICVLPCLVKSFLLYNGW